MKSELQATTAGWWLKQDDEQLAALQVKMELSFDLPNCQLWLYLVSYVIKFHRIIKLHIYH